MRVGRIVLSILIALSWTLTVVPATGQASKDCADFATQEDAQAYFDARRDDDPADPDPDDLDTDQDGFACEALPRSIDAACRRGRLCVYDDPGFAGDVVVIDRRGLSSKLAKRMNDQASSASNNRSGLARLFVDTGGKGSSICLGPGDEIADLSVWTFDDVASSSRLSRDDACPPLVPYR